MTLPVKRPGPVAPALAGKTLNRVRALLDEAFELAASPGRDLVARLADAIVADPLGALERVHKLLAPAAERAPGPGGLAVGSIGTLYLQALQQAQPQPGDAAKVIEDTGTSGVQPQSNACGDW